MHSNSLFLPFLADSEDKSSPFKNRIRKNYRHLRKWAKRTLTNCFRVYDRDIKEYPLAIDFYGGYFCVQYFSSNRNCDEASSELKEEINEVLTSLFNIFPEVIFWRSRIKRKKTEQYEKKGEQKEFFTVVEYGVKFKVNLQDYLDTGLFLDHRETRQLVASLSKGKRLLNLFAYTSSFSVHAALAGASFTKSVDLSNTYTKWSRDNFVLNAIPEENHQIVRADCLKFLDEEQLSADPYDIIVLDPPTISRSKKMEEIFDIQKDYALLIKKALKNLSKDGGVLFFSCNSRKFIFDTELFPECIVQNISEKTIPIDFQQKKSHYCWKLAFRE
jgi:23S rRNA (cytosine1962-C5)-methyltransferase